MLHDERSRERALGLMRAPTVGRDRELEQLTALVGRTTRLTIVAPPGVGKSRVLRELAASAVAAGAVVLTARLRPDLLSPFEPVAQLLERAAAATCSRRLSATRLAPQSSLSS